VRFWKQLAYYLGNNITTTVLDILTKYEFCNLYHLLYVIPISSEVYLAYSSLHFT